MLYFGPETYMPLASAFAAIAGILLMFWRRMVGGLRRILHLVHRDKAEAPQRHTPPSRKGAA